MMTIYRFASGLTLSMLMIADAVAQQTSISSYDFYGYGIENSPAACTTQFVDISTSGNELTLTSNDMTTPATDDGSAALNLSLPFELYGIVKNGFVISSNGYIVAAKDLTEEDGHDWSNDCPLPAIADNPSAGQSRIYAYHGDLDGSASGAHIWNQYFPICPRPAGSGIAESCTIIQWDNWRKRNDNNPLNFQIILYHTTFEVSLQFDQVDPSQGAQSTVGLQNITASSAALYACNNSKPILSNSAVCFFEPRYPPGSQGINNFIFKNGFEEILQ